MTEIMWLMEYISIKLLQRAIDSAIEVIQKLAKVRREIQWSFCVMFPPIWKEGCIDKCLRSIGGQRYTRTN